MSLVLQSSGGGQITLQEPTTASNFTQTLPAATGTVVISGTTPTLNGITFPATQVASADANTLDDYEEGTWTVLVTCSISGSVTTGNKTGKYVKVGNLVSVTMYIDFSAVSSPVGSIRITLPFTVANTIPSESAISCTFGNVASTNVSNFLGVVNNGTNFAEAFLGNSTGLSSTSANQLTSSSNFRLSAHYMV